MKAFGEFLLLSAVCAIILLLYLKQVGEWNWEAEHCRWDENMILQCDKRK